MVTNCTSLTVYKNEVDPAAAELDQLRTRMLEDLESFLNQGLKSETAPASRMASPGRCGKSSVGRRVRA